MRPTPPVLMSLILATVAVGSPTVLPEIDFEVAGLGIAMKWVPPGTFQRGSDPSEPGHEEDEHRHEVSLTRGFWLGRTEVTVGQWRLFLEKSAHKGVNADGGIHVRTASGWKQLPEADWLSPGFVQHDTHPVVGVSWEDAVAFCQWLTARERAEARLPDGWFYTLPTEAQWEYACRAGTGSAYAFGDELDWRLARFKPDDVEAPPRGGTAPVASFPANAWGFFDMHGNVWEWCADAYADYRADLSVDPAPAVGGKHRVKRGGSWVGAGENCRSANRNRDLPGYRSFNIGFRLCLRRE